MKQFQKNWVDSFSHSCERKVVKVSIKKSDLKDKDLEDCILKILRQWIFPSPAKGKVVKVCVTFILKIR